MKRLVLVLMILAFTISLAAARRDMPSAPLSEDIINKPLPFTTLVLTHSPAVTKSHAPSPMLLDGVTENTPPPPSPPSSQPSPLQPSKIEVHFHFNLTLKIVLPIGFASLVTIIGWLSYKYCNVKPKNQSTGGAELGIEIQPI